MKLARLLPCPTIQLHGDMTINLLRKLSQLLRPKKLIARVSVEGEKSIQRALELNAYADAIVLDTALQSLYLGYNLRSQAVLRTERYGLYRRPPH